jgi:hypothetical protein
VREPAPPSCPPHRCPVVAILRFKEPPLSSTEGGSFASGVFQRLLTRLERYCRAEETISKLARWAYLLLGRGLPALAVVPLPKVAFIHAKGGAMCKYHSPKHRDVL